MLQATRHCIRPGVLQTWHDLGRRFQTRQTLGLAVTTQAMARMAHAGHLLAQFRASQVEDLLKRSTDILHPLEDPLTIDFRLNRWLERDREEAYSDWLAWILQSLNSYTVVEEVLLGKIPAPLLIDVSRRVEYSVDREVWVPEGHYGRAGRLDCVVRTAAAVIVLELKKADADSADTAKHCGYTKWLNEQAHAKELVGNCSTRL